MTDPELASQELVRGLSLLCPKYCQKPSLKPSSLVPILNLLRLYLYTLGRCEILGVSECHECQLYVDL